MSIQIATPSEAADAEWRNHWPLVLSGAVGAAIFTTGIATLGAFISPLETQFGWTRSGVTAGLIVYSFTCLIFQPLVGRIIDRIGPRRVGLTGLALSGLALALFAVANTSIAVWLSLWVFYSLSIQLIGTAVWTAAVASEFAANRGLALAVTLSGSAVSAAVGPVMATLLIDRLGWRGAYVVIGLAPAAFVFVIAYFFFKSRLDGTTSDGSRAPELATTGVSARDGLRSPTLYKLVIATVANFMLLTGVMVHLIPILSSSGLTRESAAIAAGSFGIFGIIGKLTCGVLVKRVPGHVLTAIMMAMPIATCAMLLTPSNSLVSRMLAVGMLGGSLGAQHKMLVYLTTRHFGLRAFGTIFGFVGVGMTIATGAGPFIASYIFDMTASYKPLLIAAIPLCAVSSLIMLWVGAYPQTVENDSRHPRLAICRTDAAD